MAHDADEPLVDGVSELTLRAHDLEELTRFYTAALGLTVISREEDRVWLAAGRQARLGLWTPGEKEHGDEGGAHVHFAFAAPPGGLEALAARARDAGCTVRGPEVHDGGDRSIYLEDPEGNVVEVWDFFERHRDVDDL